VLGLAILGLCASCGGSSGPPTGNRLMSQSLHGNFWPLPGGGVVTDGMEVLQVRPGLPDVTITDVRLVGARDVRLVGARVTDPKRPTYQFSGESGWPSKDARDGVPAVGATITDAKRGWGLMVGLEVGDTGYPLIEGVEVRYAVDGQVVRQVFRGSIIFCADAQGKSQHCRPPAALQELVGYD
jgi:hypothetical protein